MNMHNHKKAVTVEGNAPQCAYSDHSSVDPKFKCPECSEGYHRFEVRDYYRKPRNGSLNLQLCDGHAGWWNDAHPFGPHAVPTTAPKD